MFVIDDYTGSKGKHSLWINSFRPKIELLCKEYSGNEHRLIKGIAIITYLYINQKTEQF